MRITARLDDESEKYLFKIQQFKNFKSITATLKYSLKYTAEDLDNEKLTGIKMKGFLESEYVGAFEGDENLSSDSKTIFKMQQL